MGVQRKFRFEDRVLFFVVPLFFLDAILGIWGFHYHHLHPNGALAVVCAALQSSPIIAFIVIAGLYLAGETDDFQKTVLVQSHTVGNWRDPGGDDVLRESGEVRLPSADGCVVGSDSVFRDSDRLDAGRSLEVQMKNRLRVLRAEREWSQADLAERLEVSRQSVNAIETGKFDPSLPLAFKLARLFETKIEGIFSDEA